MFVDLADAKATAAAFATAADSIPLVHFAAPMRTQAAEWADAVELLGELGDGYGITMLGTVVAGMRVANPTRRSADQFEATTARRAGSSQSGGWYLHYDDPDGREMRGLYTNYAGPTSPVVVWRGRPRDAEPVDVEIVDDALSGGS